MPPVGKPSLILVTGASGFLAVHVVKCLLQRGHSVRGTVRSTSKGQYLRALFDSDFPGKFEYTIVEDIGCEGAFDEAVVDVDAIAHIASPVAFSGPEDPPESLINPAVAGTLELLKSAHKYGSKVQRVVYTSSYAALLEPHDGPYQYSESDWNEYSIAEAYKAGPLAGVHKYRASKSLAERAFWRFISEQKHQFDGVAVNPPFIYGPLLHEIHSIDQLNLSSKLLWDKFAHELPDGELTAYAGNYIDVRDTAEVHADALEKAEAAGHRLVVSAGPVSHQDFYDAAHSLPAGSLPALPFAIPRGKPGAGDAVRPTFVGASPESARLLGREGTFRKLPEIVRDTLQSIVDRGLIGTVKTGSEPMRI